MEPLNEHNPNPLPRRRDAISPETFTRLCEVAREHGRDGALKWFADGAVDGEGRPSRRRTLDDYLRKYPNRAAEFEDACNARRDRLLGKLRDEIETIALGPGDVTTDFNNQGAVTRVRTDRRNKLFAILKLLQATAPDEWAERRKIDASVSGKIEHTHSQAGVYTISPGDVLALDPARAELLFDLLNEIESSRLEKNHEHKQAEPRLIESSPSLPSIEASSGASNASGD